MSEQVSEWMSGVNRQWFNGAQCSMNWTEACKNNVPQPPHKKKIHLQAGHCPAVSPDTLCTCGTAELPCTLPSHNSTVCSHNQLTAIHMHVNIETGENYSWQCFLFDNIAYAKCLALCHVVKRGEGKRGNFSLTLTPPELNKNKWCEIKSEGGEKKRKEKKRKEEAISLKDKSPPLQFFQLNDYNSVLIFILFCPKAHGKTNFSPVG